MSAVRCWRETRHNVANGMCFSPAHSRHQAKVCVCVCLIVYVRVLVCRGCECRCLPVCVYHTPMLAAGCLQYLPAVLLFSYTHTHSLSLSLFHSLPVSRFGECSRCWGPIVAQCHFLVLLISSLCCRWLSLKGCTHMLMHTHKLVHSGTHMQPCYLLTSPSLALLLAPQ